MLVSNRFNIKIDDDYKTFTRRFDALKRHFRTIVSSVLLSYHDSHEVLLTLFIQTAK